MTSITDIVNRIKSKIRYSTCVCVCVHFCTSPLQLIFVWTTLPNNHCPQGMFSWAQVLYRPLLNFLAVVPIYYVHVGLVDIHWSIFSKIYLLNIAPASTIYECHFFLKTPCGIQRIYLPFEVLVQLYFFMHI